MTLIDTHLTGRRSSATEPRTVCLTFGPADDLSHLLRAAAEVLDGAGVVPAAIEPKVDAEGTWLRVTCEVDPAEVATLVSLPALADHRVDHSPKVVAERCQACELREYLREL